MNKYLIPAFCIAGMFGFANTAHADEAAYDAGAFVSLYDGCDNVADLVEANPKLLAAVLALTFKYDRLDHARNSDFNRGYISASSLMPGADARCNAAAAIIQAGM